MSTTPSTFISGLYSNVLRRSVAAGTATTAELLSWDTLRTSGVLTDTQITSAFVNSSEATNFVTPIIRIYQTFYNRVPDSGGLDFWAARLRAGTSTLAQISSAFSGAAEFTTLYGAASANNADAFITALYTNVLGRTADAGGFAFWKAQYTALGSNAAAAASVAQAFSGSAEFITSSATNITNLLTSVASTGSLGTGPLGGTGGSSSGTTSNFTTSIESFTGSSANDTFQGVQSNFGSLDSINGGSGTDTLSLITTGAITLSSGNITSIETIVISATTATAAVTIAGLTGITTVSNTSSVQDVTFGAASNTGGLAAVPALNVSSNGTTNTILNLTDTAVAGSADALTLTLTANGGGTITLNNTTADSSGLETINVVSSGSSTNTTTLASVADTNNPTVNISGSANLSLTLGTTLTTTAKTISASAATGNVTLLGLGAAVHTITGGSGADTFTFGANFVGAENATTSSRDTVNGGAGRDTLSITDAVATNIAASANSQSTVTNVEIITISDASTQNIDLTKFVGADTLAFGNASIGANTFTFNTGSTATFVTAAAGNNARTFTVGGTGSTDVLNITAVAGTDFGSAAQTFSGIETLNISTGTGAPGTAVIFGGTLVTTPTAGSTASIVVTGVNALTLTGAVTAAKIDASALTGVLTVTAAPTIAISITGGTAADVINGSTGSDLLVGGAGADSITGRAGNDILTGSAGADNFLQLTAVDNGIDSITDFTAGTGGDKFTISIAATNAGISQIRNGAGNASVTAAATVGIKEITAATTLATADNVIVLTGTFANAAAVQTAIEAGGTRALTFANATTAGDDIIVVWSDGTLGHISNVNIASAATTITASNATAIDLTTLTGVTSVTAGQFVAANFAFIA